MSDALAPALMEELPFRARLLVVDDSDTFCNLIERAFGKTYDVALAHDEAAALSVAQQFKPHLILLDLHLPPDVQSPRVGLKLLDLFRQQLPGVRVIVVSGTRETRDAMDAVAAGAADFYTKPIALDELKIVLKRNLQIIALEMENKRLSEEMKAGKSAAQLIGSSPAFLQSYSLVQRVAPTETTVLLWGENGTGKELFAKEIHRLSDRANGPFSAINCGAIPESLAEGELFGFIRGAFTGAVRDREGRIKAADGGTLFLDEIGELTEHLQTKLLRFLQERQIEPVGSSKTVEVDTRIIAATNRDLRQMVAQGTFREDLYYRLNVIEIKLPPLRERREDIVPLANFFLRQNRELARGRTLRLADDARAWLEHYAFPGNVRELENIIKRAMLLAPGAEIRAEDFSAHVPQGMAPAGPVARVVPTPPPVMEGSLKDVREAAERAAIEAALTAEGGNISRAAKRLDVERKSLQRLIKRLGIDVGRYCPEGAPKRGRPPLLAEEPV